MRHRSDLHKHPAIPAAVIFVANLVVLFVLAADGIAAEAQAQGFLNFRGSTACLTLADMPGCDLGFSCARMSYFLSSLPRFLFPLL
jgi:hypothetical protein